MKKMLALMIVFTIIAIAIPAMATDHPFNLGKAISPPTGAKISISDAGGSRVLNVSGLDVYKNRVEIYGGDGIEYCILQNSSCTYPAGRWLNLMFKSSDRNYHYILVTDEYRMVRQPWMGEGVSVMPNFGKGAALIYVGDLRKEYR